MSGIVAIEGIVRDYAWGSPTLVPELTGWPATGAPVAEVWFGAHPDDPSAVPSTGSDLGALIDTDPVGLLGAGSVARFGPQLPFLLKLLAAEKALSIQVHPTLAQAHAGYAADDDAGIARDAPDRRYRDANHKPELLCALTPFRALCGFRNPARTVELIDAFPPGTHSALQAIRDELTGDADETAALRRAFTRVLGTPQADRPGLVAAVVTGAQSLLDGPWHDAARALLDAAADFPGDIGVVLTLLLNAVTLAPGQAIFLGAGTVHAYLRGLGVEVMASSDNVLRCGLTAKHVDVPELLRITGFASLGDPVRTPEPVLPGVARFEVPVPDFALTVVDLPDATPVEQQDAGARIVLCTAGRVQAGPVVLTPGSAAFVPAGAILSLHAEAGGQVFLASVGTVLPGFSRPGDHTPRG